MAGEGSGQGEGSQMVGGGELCNLPTQCPVTRGKAISLRTYICRASRQS